MSMSMPTPTLAVGTRVRAVPNEFYTLDRFESGIGVVKAVWPRGSILPRGGGPIPFDLYAVLWDKRRTVCTIYNGTQITPV